MLKSICLGVIGGGQLGSLLCSAAKKLKVKTVVLSDDKDGPAQHFCDEFIYNKYDDCLLYTCPSPRDISGSRMPSSA